LLFTNATCTATQRDGWITLKKQNRTFVAGHTLAMFSAAFFPTHESVKLGMRVPLTTLGGEEVKPLTLGPWWGAAG
jgi:hypothetical protein